jgi:hypothetical protein
VRTSFAKGSFANDVKTANRVGLDRADAATASLIRSRSLSVLLAPALASSSLDDDAMMRKREPMTIDGLKRATDRQFDRLRRHMDRRFDRLDRTKADKSEVRTAIGRLETELRRQAEQSRQQEEETRRHFDVVAESLRDDLRLFADAIAAHSERLIQHDTRIGRLERRLL